MKVASNPSSYASVASAFSASMSASLSSCGACRYPSTHSKPQSMSLARMIVSISARRGEAGVPHGLRARSSERLHQFGQPRIGRHREVPAGVPCVNLSATAPLQQHHVTCRPPTAGTPSSIRRCRRPPPRHLRTHRGRALGRPAWMPSRTNTARYLLMCLDGEPCPHRFYCAASHGSHARAADGRVR